jgi:hypothetical protein
MLNFRVLTVALTVVFSVPGLSGCGSTLAKMQTIYDQDNRTPMTESNPNLAVFGPSIALLTRSFRLQDLGNQKFKLTAPKFGDFFGLCRNESFFEEPILGDCTGFLVDDTHLVTAGHCISSQSDCEQRSFVFNQYKSTQPNLHSSEIYSCRRIVSSLAKDDGDLVVVELDRAVTQSPLSKYFNLDANENQNPNNLVTLGHPSGLPLKSAPLEGLSGVALGAYFWGKADVSGGSSGSPLFDPRTGSLQGVVIGGENDFVWDSKESCSRSRVCTNESCSGERFATRDALLRLLKK